MRELLKLLEITKGGSPHVILADLNSLTCSDYTAKEWQSICAERAKNQWEAPQVEVTSTLAQYGYVDVLSACKAVTGTCRFGTRVDYVLTYANFVCENQC